MLIKYLYEQSLQTISPMQTCNASALYCECKQFSVSGGKVYGIVMTKSIWCINFRIE